MTPLDQALTAMRWVLWLAMTGFGGFGMAFWIISFRVPAAGDALQCLTTAVLIFYARERTR
jgi:hypothetical protein